MPIISKKEEINNEVLKHIFGVRAISLEEIYIKIVKEKEQICLNVLDNDSYNEKILLDKLNGINKKDLEIKKGDVIGQAIFHKYYIADGDVASGERLGGFGSTSK